MKKLLVVLMGVFLLFSISYSKNLKTNNIIEVNNDAYPYTDPYVATIVGSSSMMMDGVTEYSKLNKKEYVMKIKEHKLPEALWYEKGFKFSLIKQKKEAPLIFLIAGTGATHNSLRMRYLQSIFYDAGYNVISISSSVQMNFILNASSTRLPGPLMEDAEDIYEIMQKTYEHVKKEIKVTDFYLAGYSLGAAQSAFVSYIDEHEKKFNFKRVYMINPVVNLKSSAIKLDNLLDDNIDGSKKNIGVLIEEILDEVSRNLKADRTTLNEEEVYKLFKNKIISEKKMKAIIGFAFRMIAIDTNYITDLIHERKLYGDTNLEKFTPLFPYYERINFASFYTYLEDIALPIKNERGVNEEEVLNSLRINEIEKYLKNTDKIAMITNKDEIILDDREIEYLKTVFGNRMILYPHGGHCGNMFYKSNVDVMLNYLETGRLEDVR